LLRQILFHQDKREKKNLINRSQNNISFRTTVRFIIDRRDSGVGGYKSNLLHKCSIVMKTCKRVGNVNVFNVRTIFFAITHIDNIYFHVEINNDWNWGRERI